MGKEHGYIIEKYFCEWLFTLLFNTFFLVSNM